MDSELHGVGARLEYRDEPRVLPDLLAEAVDGGPDSGRMVGEVIVELHPGELALVLHAAERRLKGAERLNGSLRIDYAAGCAYIGENEIHLTPIEYRLLCLLAKNTGKVLTHNYILKEIWGSYSASDVGSLRVFMATLRKKLALPAGDPPLIQTHVGVGYRMIRVEEKTE